MQFTSSTVVLNNNISFSISLYYDDVDKYIPLLFSTNPYQIHTNISPKCTNSTTYPALNPRHALLHVKFMPELMSPVIDVGDEAIHICEDVGRVSRSTSFSKLGAQLRRNSSRLVDKLKGKSPVSSCSTSSAAHDPRYTCTQLTLGTLHLVGSRYTYT